MLAPQLYFAKSRYEYLEGGGGAAVLRKVDVRVSTWDGEWGGRSCTVSRIYRSDRVSIPPYHFHQGGIDSMRMRNPQKKSSVTA